MTHFDAIDWFAIKERKEKKCNNYMEKNLFPLSRYWQIIIALWYNKWNIAIVLKKWPYFLTLTSQGAYETPNGYKGMISVKTTRKNHFSKTTDHSCHMIRYVQIAKVTLKISWTILNYFKSIFEETMPYVLCV